MRWTSSAVPFYRLLVTGGPIDECPAENVVELILRGFAPTTRRAAQHPTVYLPSHDPESAARLAGAITVS